MVFDIFDNEFLKDFFPWDKKSYAFKRDEKDMHPYTIMPKEKEVILTHNILGVCKEDLNLSIKKINDNIINLQIQGKTIDKITGKEYSINSIFELDGSLLDLDKMEALSQNGLLYIIIPRKQKTKEKSKARNISIK